VAVEVFNKMIRSQQHTLIHLGQLDSICAYKIKVLTSLFYSTAILSVPIQRS
jgi:hypothetical protein